VAAEVGEKGDTPVVARPHAGLTLGVAENLGIGLLGAVRGDSEGLGINAGFEWTRPLGFDLLLAGGTYLESWGGPRVDWTAYAGLRKTFKFW